MIASTSFAHPASAVMVQHGDNNPSIFVCPGSPAQPLAVTREDISFSIGADDMAFAYLDGQLVCDLGGIHPDSPGTCTTPGEISAGDHTLEVFFTDMNQTQAALSFSVTTQGVTTTGPPGVPEPGTFTLLGSGLLSLAGLARRKFVQKA